MQEIEKQRGWRESLDRLLFYAKQVVQPTQPGSEGALRAVTANGRTTFRVWAPHAERVFVAGPFNGWSAWRTPLALEGNGVWSVDVTAVAPGTPYQFAIHRQGQILWRTDPRALDVAGPQQVGVVTDPTFTWTPPEERPFTLPGWHELVIYELHVGTFSPGEPVGGFQGVIERLPYLRDLGINAIELMPVNEFPGDYSWGYNPAYPFAITRTYGGRTGLKQLIQAAHDHGIAVLVDVVYNHYGPQDLSMWQFDGWHEQGKGGIYFYNDWRSKTPWADTRPDYGRSEVRQMILENVQMWLEEFQVDGLRWDATSFIRNVHGHDGDPGADIPEGWQLMQQANEWLDGRQPWKLMIAEDLQSNGGMTAAVAQGGAGFDAQWDAQFVHPVRHALITPHDEDRDLTAVAQAIAFRYNQNPWQRIIYTESHDEVANGKARVPEEITPGMPDSVFAKKRSLLGAAILFTTPGIPMIFQGQEFLSGGWFDDHMPLDWSLADTHAGVLAFYRELIGLRRNRNGRTRGLTGPHVHLYHIDNTDKVLAYHRWQDGGPGDDVIVIVNFSHRLLAGETIGLPHGGLWRVRLNSDEQRFDATFTNHICPDVIAAPVKSNAADGLPYWGNITLAPYSVLILSQDVMRDT